MKGPSIQSIPVASRPEESAGHGRPDADPRPAARERESAPALLLALLTEIEQELCRQEQWEPIPPPPSAFESRLPFCCDSMRFTQWLQWVLIPRTRALIEAEGPWPTASGIRPMAEEALRGCKWPTIPLMVLLDRFDRLIDRGKAEP